MAGSSWIKWFPSDFLTGIAGLSSHEIAVYTVILNLIYDADGPIKDDPPKLARRCGVRLGQCNAALNTLQEDGKITRNDGLIHNERAVKVIETRQEQSAKRAISAATRWNNTEQKQNGKLNKNSDDPMQVHLPEHANASNPSCVSPRGDTRYQIQEKKVPPNPQGGMIANGQPAFALGSAPNEPKKRTPRKPNGLAAEYEKEFEEEFWPDWPNKVAKPAGRKGFIKARQRGATLKELIDGRDRYIASKPPGRDWVNPGTFFNQERYADMPAEETLPLVRKDGDSWIVTIGTPEADAHEKRFNAENSSRYYDLHGRPKGTEVRVSTRWPARYN